MYQAEKENPQIREFSWLLNSQRTGHNDFLTVDGMSLYKDIQKVLSRLTQEAEARERARCLQALPPERIIHEYMPSQNTPENRAWNEYRNEAIKAIALLDAESKTKV